MHKKYFTNESITKKKVPSRAPRIPGGSGCGHQSWW